MKINVPKGNYITFQVQTTEIEAEYNITMYFDENYKIWYIRVKYNDVDTGFVGLTVEPILFVSYKNIMPHCFYCITETGFNPNTEDCFDNKYGYADLLIDTWDNRIKEL